MTQYLSLQFVNMATGRLNIRGATDNINLGLPEVAGLDLVCEYVDGGSTKILATCPDDSRFPVLENGRVTRAIVTLSESEFLLKTGQIFNDVKETIRKDTINRAFNLINILTEKYPVVEIAYAIANESQYISAMDADTEDDARIKAPSLVIESDISGISVKDLASTYLQNINNYRVIEGKIKGTRRKILNEIDNVVFEQNAIKESFLNLRLINHSALHKLENEV